MMTTTSMASPRNKHCFDDDEGPSSTLPPAPLRPRVGNKVGVEVPPVVQVVVPPPVAEKVVLVPQEGNGRDDGKGSGSDDCEDKAMHISLSGQLILGSCGTSGSDDSFLDDPF
jgi:hypothetical protein